METFMYSSTNWPKSAKDVMTINEIAAACHASLILSFAVLSETKAKKIGVAPGGSIITSRVTKD